MRVSILILSVVLAGCTTHQPARVADKGLAEARQACQLAYDQGRITSREARARCLNDAENRFTAGATNQRAIRQQQALRIDLARKVDSGRLTQAQADAQFVSGMRRIDAQSAR
jgi:hypothetical protein